VIATEVGRTFACFGSTCAVLVSGDAEGRSAAEAVAGACRRLLDWHERFSRFRPGSELSRLNADARAEVPVSPTMARLVAAVVAAAEQSGGLVDGTLLREIESAGYTGDRGAPLPPALVLRLAPARRPAGPNPAARWREIALVADATRVRRPPGLALDSGGLAKGLFADLLAEELAPHASFAVNCAGDLRVGGATGEPRTVHVESPFGGAPLHTYALAGAGVATSGIARRSWLGADLRPAHHLLDPATGAPAFTGVVQATAVAPTALEAELRAKAALLAGPAAAAEWLPHGGVVVFDDGRHEVLERP
jgi:thiamine biosynthesis lipoprotein